MVEEERVAEAEAGERSLPPDWRRIQSAIWLIGLALIAWQGWWWPGILVLVAVSGLAEALIRMQISRQQIQADAVQQAKELAATRAVALPETCPNCGSPINAAEVKWSSDITADCPFCGSNLKAIEETFND